MFDKSDMIQNFPAEKVNDKNFGMNNFALFKKKNNKFKLPLDFKTKPILDNGYGRINIYFEQYVKFQKQQKLLD
jgi:hypothetical protein